MDDKIKVLFDDGEHKCIMFSFDDESHEDSFLSVNQYLIVQNGVGVLIDPSSQAIFDELYDAVSKFIDITKIKFIFLSHQDPDVSASIGEWAGVTPAKFIMSSLWVRFMSHYGFMDMSRIVSLVDHGAKLNFGQDALKFIPAHFLHSPGNFSLYDTRSKILFSGDIGAAVITSSQDGTKEVDNFEEHKSYLEGFHKRYMGSNKLCKAWVEKVRENDINMIAPQHGYVFKDKDVANFLNWFEELQCGSDFIQELY
jgi:flavorubredoxin